MILAFLLIINFLVCISAYPVALSSKNAMLARRRHQSTSSTESVVVESTTKKELLACVFDDRAHVNALILSLERSNPTLSNAVSKMDGVWTVLYSGSLTDPGMLVYQVAKSLPSSAISLSDLTVSVAGTKASSSCTANLAGNVNIPLTVETSIEPYGMSGMSFKETYSIGKTGELELPFPSFISTNIVRDMIVTYLDDDLIILRDKFGCPDVLKKSYSPVKKSTDPINESSFGNGEEMPGDYEAAE